MLQQWHEWSNWNIQVCDTALQIQVIANTISLLPVASVINTQIIKSDVIHRSSKQTHHIATTVRYCRTILIHDHFWDRSQLFTATTKYDESWLRKKRKLAVVMFLCRCRDNIKKTILFYQKTYAGGKGIVRESQNFCHFGSFVEKAREKFSKTSILG